MGGRTLLPPMGGAPLPSMEEEVVGGGSFLKGELGGWRPPVNTHNVAVSFHILLLIVIY